MGNPFSKKRGSKGQHGEVKNEHSTSGPSTASSAPRQCDSEQNSNQYSMNGGTSGDGGSASLGLSDDVKSGTYVL